MQRKNFLMTFNQFVDLNIKILPFWILLLFISFVCGNIFGIYSKYFQNFYFLILIILFILEFISLLKYSKNIQSKEKLLLKNNFLTKIFNVFKRGFLIGLFVEAFKVGS